MSKYDLNNPIHKQKFKDYCNSLFKKGEFVELRKINPLRSNNQNAYLHLILGWFAIEYGETLEYIKEEFFKKKVNKDIFQTEYANVKTGECRVQWKSSSDLDTKEMTLAINRFRDYASKEADIYLPEANENEYLKQIQVEMENKRQYI